MDFHDENESGTEEQEEEEVSQNLTPSPFSPQFDEEIFLFSNQFDIQLSVTPKLIQTPIKTIKKTSETTKASIFTQSKTKKPIFIQKRYQSKFVSEGNLIDYNGNEKSNGTVRHFQSPQPGKKKSKKIPKIAMKELKPLNLEKEKEIFFQQDCNYDPQFEYANQQNLDNQFLNRPHQKYLNIARNIIKCCLAEFGTLENFSEQQGGLLMTQLEVEQYFQKYIEDFNVKDLVSFEFSTNTVAPTSVIHSNQDNSSRIVVGLPITYRRDKIQGVLDHEIGTHFVRSFNEKKQLWYKKRDKFNLQPHIKNEEGLAVLNQTISVAIKSNSKPYLYLASVHYIAAILSSQLSFSQLYQKLQEYMQDPEQRFRECLRVKRGVSDTSQKGGMYKDQVYLIGALKVLKYRNKINFYSLHAGKITVKDCIRLSEKGLIQTDKMKIPLFLKDLNLYKKALDRIAEINQIQ